LAALALPPDAFGASLAQRKPNPLDSNAGLYGYRIATRMPEAKKEAEPPRSNLNSDEPEFQAAPVDGAPL